MNRNSPDCLKRLALSIYLGILAFVITGCDKEDKNKFELQFSHYNHIEDYDAACSDCHGEAKDGRFMPPNHDSCVDCHDDWIDADVGKDTCGSCHVVKDLSAFAEREIPEPLLPMGGAFVHTEALAGLCQDCHGDLFGEDLKRVPKLNRDDVLEIRETAHRSDMDCASCHVDMDPDVPPPNHDQAWMDRHGEWGMQDDNTCAVCHTEQSCSECHQISPPKSHNNLFRLKTHGVKAEWDRERCMVCHEQDSCNTCHAEIRPQSHNAGWERNHCVQCHSSEATGTGCALCHEGSLDSHPNPHPAGWESSHCQNCHNGSPKSEQCGICHEGSLFDGHPNPHPANWETGHCNNCHDGELNGVSCGACHETSGIADHPNPHSASFERTHCDSCHAGSESEQECGICHEGAGSVLIHQDFWPPVHDRFGESADCMICH